MNQTGTITGATNSLFPQLFTIGSDPLDFVVQDIAVIMVVAAIMLAITYKLKQPMVIPSPLKKTKTEISSWSDSGWAKESYRTMSTMSSTAVFESSSATTTRSRYWSNILATPINTTS